jgi:hypothetical protein
MVAETVIYSEKVPDPIVFGPILALSKLHIVFGFLLLIA